MAEAHQRSQDIAHGQGTLGPGADPKVDPLGPATFHGKEPSRGAKTDAEIMAEVRGTRGAKAQGQGRGVRRFVKIVQPTFFSAVMEPICRVS